MKAKTNLNTKHDKHSNLRNNLIQVSSQGECVARCNKSPFEPTLLQLPIYTQQTRLYNHSLIQLIGLIYERYYSSTRG